MISDNRIISLHSINNSSEDDEDTHAGGGEEEKCLRIVRRVLDEETVLEIIVDTNYYYWWWWQVLEMVSTFLQLSQDHAMPPSASVTFHTAHFDPESGNKRGYGYFYPILMHKPSGLYVLKAYLNYYMLSKVSSYQISHLLTILVSAEQEAAGLPPCDGVHADREQPPLQHPHQDRRHQHPVIELDSAN